MRLRGLPVPLGAGTGGGSGRDNRGGQSLTVPAGSNKVSKHTLTEEIGYFVKRLVVSLVEKCLVRLVVR